MRPFTQYIQDLWFNIILPLIKSLVLPITIEGNLSDSKSSLEYLPVLRINAEKTVRPVLATKSVFKKDYIRPSRNWLR